MTIREMTEDRVNLFVDGELDTDEMDEIRKAVLDDKELRERVCQLKAVRELVGYAYSNVPGSRHDQVQNKQTGSIWTKAIAASVTLVVGVFLGWETYQYSPQSIQAISAENTFQYVANHVAANHTGRKIVLHVDSGDLKVINAALNEVDQLLETYKKANLPIELDVVANKGGIDMLRVDISPYGQRIQKLIDDKDVSFYACQRSISKAHAKEGSEIVMMPGVETTKTAREIIPDLLKKGWVYIRA
ncbi:MAG: hypothetical protein RQ982_08915 [Gammaproteobacteria bacterium]|nr:hypothetical protein [Gammaproteobacteria bacterium]